MNSKQLEIVTLVHTHQSVYGTGGGRPGSRDSDLPHLALPPQVLSQGLGSASVLASDRRLPGLCSEAEACGGGEWAGLGSVSPEVLLRQMY